MFQNFAINIKFLNLQNIHKNTWILFILIIKIKYFNLSTIDRDICVKTVYIFLYSRQKQEKGQMT